MDDLLFATLAGEAWCINHGRTATPQQFDQFSYRWACAFASDGPTVSRIQNAFRAGANSMADTHEALRIQASRCA